MSSSRLRVVVIDHTAELGGAELALMRLLDAIGDRADVTTLLLSHGPLVDLLRARGHAVRVVPMGAEASIRRDDLVRMALSPLRLPPVVRRTARVVRELNVDVIHTTSLKADVLGLAIAALARRPLVWHVHDRIATDYLPHPAVRFLRAAARWPAAVIANSEATAATLPGRRDIVVAPPGLAPDQIRSEPRPRPAGDPVIGLVGRISPTKDQLTFVRAVSLVQQAHPTATFEIVGGAAFGAEDYEEEVRDEVARLGLERVVTLPGFTSDVTALLDRLTVCVHTAGVPEPFGQAVIEAMGRGVPVVATAGGGVDEIFACQAYDHLGWVVPAASPKALAGAIVEAIGHPLESEQRGRRGWESVKTRYPVSRTADTVVSVWEVARCVSRRRPPSNRLSRDDDGRRGLESE